MCTMRDTIGNRFSVALSARQGILLEQGKRLKINMLGQFRDFRKTLVTKNRGRCRDLSGLSSIFYAWGQIGNPTALLTFPVDLSSVSSIPNKRFKQK